MRFSLLLFMMLFIINPVRSQDTMTLAECITQSGYTTEVYGTLPYNLEGINAWDNSEPDVMLYGERFGTMIINTNTGDRRVVFIRYENYDYFFVYKDRHEPGAIEQISENRVNWHGACLLKIL